MGRSSRAKRIRKYNKVPQPEKPEIATETIELCEESNAQIVEQLYATNDSDAITDVVPIMKEQNTQRKTASAYNPNSAPALLNSILTTLLTQEYNRLHQQLINIKTQLDEQKSIVGQMTEEKLDKTSDEDILDC